jgi:hypothetical protein
MEGSNNIDINGLEDLEKASFLLLRESNDA